MNICITSHIHEILMFLFRLISEVSASEFPENLTRMCPRVVIQKIMNGGEGRGFTPCVLTI